MIFGGHYYEGKQSGFTYLNDTHVLDVNSSRWIKPRISGTPPPPRYGHTAVLAGARIIIFGGKGSNTVFRDLHALDPLTMTWFQGPEGGGAPASRFDHSANLVNGTKMVIFGGWNGNDFFNDVYVLDLQMMAWSKPNTSGKYHRTESDLITIDRPGSKPQEGSLCHPDWLKPRHPRRFLVQRRADEARWR